MIRRTNTRPVCGPPIAATILLAVGLTVPAAAQSHSGQAQPVTAKLVLGPQAGTAKPSQRGTSYTGGGNIEVAQPTPDTIVISMGGTVAASSSLITSGEALLAFFHEQQFAVQFSDPVATGKLFMQVKINGLLRGAGKHASVGLTNAVSSILAGPNELARLPIAPRMAGGCDSSAVSVTQGPLWVPVHAGCYSVRQQFSIFASQPKSWGCHKASAQFSAGSLNSTWIGTTDPFQSADASNLGYELILRVVPDASENRAASDAGFTQLFSAP